MSPEELNDIATKYKAEFQTLVNKQVWGKTFIRNIQISINGYGCFRVTVGGKILYTGSNPEEASEQFNDAVKELSAEAYAK